MINTNYFDTSFCDVLDNDDLKAIKITRNWLLKICNNIYQIPTVQDFIHLSTLNMEKQTRKLVCFYACYLIMDDLTFEKLPHEIAMDAIDCAIKSDSIDKTSVGPLTEFILRQLDIGKR